MAFPFDLAVGEWGAAPATGNYRIQDVFASPNPGGTQANITNAWIGAAFDSLRGDVLIKGGGHDSYHGNEIYAYNIVTCQFRIKMYYSAPTTDAEENADGTPTSAHTYSAFVYHPVRDTVLRLPGVAPDLLSGGFTPRVYEYDCSVEDAVTAQPSAWTQKSNHAGGDAAALWDYDSVTGRMYGFYAGGSSDGGIRSYNAATDTHTSHTTFDDQPHNPHNMTCAIGYTGGVGYCAMLGAGRCQIKKLSDFSWAGTSGTNFGATGDTAIESESGPGFGWDGNIERFIAWGGLLAGGTDRRDYYELNVGTKVWTRRTGTGDVPPAPITNHTYTRFINVGDGLWAYVPDTATTTYFLRVAASTAPTAGGPLTRGGSLLKGSLLRGGRMVG